MFLNLRKTTVYQIMYLIFVIFLLISSDVMFADEDSGGDGGKGTKPSVLTNSTTLVSNTSANLYGTILSSGSSEIVTYGIKYGTSTDYAFNISTSLDENIFVGGATTNEVRKYYKTNLSLSHRVSYGGTIRSIFVDGDFVYIGGDTTQRVRKYWKSNLSYTTIQSSDYGGSIYAIFVDGDFVYVAGASLPERRIKKYWKSNLSYANIQSPGYGGIILRMFVDGDFVYAGGDTTQQVRKYWKSNLSYTNIQSDTYGGNIWGLSFDDQFVYVGGTSLEKIRKYWKSNLSYTNIQSNPYGGNIRSLVVDGDFVYVGGDATQRVRKYWKSNLSYTNIQSSDYGGGIYAIFVDNLFIFYGGQTTNYVVKIWKTNLSYTGNTANYGGAVYAINGSYHIIPSFPYTFNVSVSGLSPGMLYHYCAYASNNDGYSFGADKYFLTKPLEPLSVVFNSYDAGSFNISFTKGTGANNTIVVMKALGYPSSINDGDFIFNTTKSYVSSVGYDPGSTYYFCLWSYSSYLNKSQVSNEYVKNPLLLRPSAISNGKLQKAGLYTYNLSWTAGSGSNRSIIVKKAYDYPSSINDGTILYNGSKNYTLINMNITDNFFFSGWSYKNFTFDDKKEMYCLSNEKYDFLTPFCTITVYNESNTSQKLTASIIVSTTNGSKTRSFTDMPTPFYFNLQDSDIPEGNCVFIVSSKGYQTRSYFYYINKNSMYNLSFFLPPVSMTEYGSYEDCSLRTFSDSVVVSSYTKNVSIPLTYKVENIIGVEIFNKSLYQYYGGWLNVPGSMYKLNMYNVTVDKKFLDKNTTQARVTYYYLFCPNVTVRTQLYRLHVIDERGGSISRALIEIRKFFNFTDYTVVSRGYSDGYGDYDVYLIPGSQYFVSINKSGFYNLSDFWITDKNYYGMNYPKIFQLIALPFQYKNIEIIFDDILISGVLLNTSISINYRDITSKTVNISIFIYRLVNDSYVLFSNSFFSSNSFFYNISANSSFSYFCVFYVNHSNYEYFKTSLFLNAKSKKSSIDILFNRKLPISFSPLSFSSIFALIISIVILMSFSPNKRDNFDGLSIMLVGGVLGMMNVFFGFDIISLSICGILLLLGVLIFIKRSIGGR